LQHNRDIGGRVAAPEQLADLEFDEVEQLGSPTSVLFRATTMCCTPT
jgi:hypothetical protein